MAFFVFTQAVAGQVATAVFYNNNLNAISIQFNGNIDDANLADLSVGTNALKSSAVTTSKLAAAVILGLSTVTAVVTDYVAISDTSDSGNIKKALVSDLVPIAAQADMEAASSNAKFVTPLGMKWHPGVAKVWALCDTSGSGTLNSSYNVSSITRNGTGSVTFNFTTNFSAGTFAALASADTGSAHFCQTGSKLVGSVTVTVQQTTTNSAVDGIINLACFGDQ